MRNSYIRRLYVVARHYYYVFILWMRNDYEIKPVWVTDYNNMKQYISFLYVDNNWKKNNVNHHSARNIHIRTTKDTSPGNHGGY